MSWWSCEVSILIRNIGVSPLSFEWMQEHMSMVNLSLLSTFLRAPHFAAAVSLSQSSYLGAESTGFHFYCMHNLTTKMIKLTMGPDEEVASLYRYAAVTHRFYHCIGNHTTLLRSVNNWSKTSLSLFAIETEQFFSLIQLFEVSLSKTIER